MIVFLPYLALLVLLLVASAFFSGSESAFFSLDRYALEKLEQEQSRSARTVGLLLAKPRKLLATILTGNELVNITLSSVGLAAVLELKDLRGWEQVPWWLNIVVITPLLLLFGEIAPKAVAVRSSSAWARKVAVPLNLFGTLIAPVLTTLDGIARGLLILLRIQPDDPLPAALEEAQFRALVELGEKQGAIEPEEAQLIHRVFELTDTPVSRIMTSRADVVMVAVGRELHELLGDIANRRFSRVPVFAGDPDNIKGVLLTKDLLRFRWDREPFDPRKLEQLASPAYFVPPGKPCGELLQEFQQERGHMAIVLDEHGAMLGVVTMQDLLDELFEPFEELTERRSAPGIEHIAPGVFRIPAKMEIADWNRSMEPELPTGDAYNTIAGYIFHLFGRLPRKGESIRDGAWFFHVSGLEGTRVTWITARRRDGGRR